MNKTPAIPGGFDETYDVVVVGFGLAGGIAAISAHDQGARVLLLEKMPDPGGISICAGGGVRTVTDLPRGRLYLREAAGPDVPDAVLDALAEGMAGLEDYLRELATVDGARIERRERGGNYPFPGHDALGILEVAEIPGFDAAREYPHVRGRLLGPNLFKLVHDNVRARDIEVRLGCAAERLVTDAEGAVIGLSARAAGRPLRIAARRGVVLASGGFEAAPEMQRKYWQIRPVLPAATRGNTGDGIRMAQAVGADLWHMWHFHGSYGFRHCDPDYPFAIRVKRLPDWTPRIREPEVPMSWIMLDQSGRRFMNEYHPYLQDTGHRPLDQFDPVTQGFPKIPAFLVVDEEGRKLYPLGQAVLNDRDVQPYAWSADNLREVENGILRKADSIEELAGLLGADPAVLAASLERWNRQCERGLDDDHGRPPASMTPVRSAPFYVGKLWPLVNNTQGGPVHDARQRILDSFGEPIARLYAAGELGSIWGFLYLGAGNLAECFVSGRIAGAHAACLPSWQDS
ncbi:fumarate reductase/succinate dehyfrogenase, flavoprotein subunit [Azotobacter vinelandii CA]|uniref:Fumarate reductase/succinate dehyfrogenase, flavoprotein subunit n=2 Tax=Azotobacter vinelandii TaxID=354 RepID=C1DFD0_AZOVD|nr:FAD-dependent oxidoreductase [Azotobacter vinelandii]ACO78333.1 fumarate reductase/succinate dehyfrogenase, flavoprotein subunit [Azotobacter vinelandii DJ]AGK15055.1 fumarate reductase/succinate dehyfrogenase, flavoprotein subunit [Azotobacter vinelandii CA]AGK20420.1 fumarate reductase/succinate dehyfrogenase, flavoprotein subunit [Azotobacter vinelandii CA6]WKN24055.1 FAD-binding protein [Azotobacter vinelandii]SFY08613.1 Succinate dehydrogenase/fumarate reductase, flavoprotein subunit [